MSDHPPAPQQHPGGEGGGGTRHGDERSSKRPLDDVPPTKVARRFSSNAAVTAATASAAAGGTGGDSAADVRNNNNNNDEWQRGGRSFSSSGSSSSSKRPPSALDLVEVATKEAKLAKGDAAAAATSSASDASLLALLLALLAPSSASGGGAGNIVADVPPGNDVSLQLHDALRQRQPLDIIEQILLLDPASVTRKNRDEWSALHVAAAIDASVKVTQLLVDKCPKALEERTDKGLLPLHLAACVNASVEVVQLLIDKCPKALEERDNDGFMPLHYAARHSKSTEVVRRLIDKYRKALKERNKYGCTPLHEAALFNTAVEVVRLLIDTCPEALEERNDFGHTPLHVAAHLDDVDVVRLLIKRCPVALKVVENDGLMPLHCAATRTKSVEVLEALVKGGPEALTHADNNGQRPVDLARLRGDEKKGSILSWLENATLLQEQAAGRRDEDPKTSAAPLSFAADPYQEDRDRLREVVDLSNCGLVSVSGPNKQPFLAGFSGTVYKSCGSVSMSDFCAESEIPGDGILGTVSTSCGPVSLSVAYVQSILTDDVLGAGYFGTVFKGIDPILGREFAIKSINTKTLQGGSPQDIEAAMKTFRKEQEALSRFRHPNIAGLFGYTDPSAEQGVAAGGYHLVYELAEKGSLEKFLSNDLGRSRLGSFIRRVQIAVDVFTAIRFLHVGRENVASCFHRDVKSANVVIKRNFTAQLIDCGIAKFVRDDSVTFTTTGIQGTPGYICPEYAAGGIPYEEACDVYSFGVVLAELWTGRLQNYKDMSGSPFNFDKNYIRCRKENRRDILKDVDPVLDCDGPLPEYMSKFALLALSCMAGDTEDRPSGAEVLNELRSIRDAGASSETIDHSMSSRSSSISTFASLANLTLPSSTGWSAEHCTTCRTFPSVPGYETCMMCLISESVRKAISDIQGDGLNHLARTDSLIDPMGKGLSRQVDVVDSNIDSALPVLAHLDTRLNHQVPRLFIMIPDGLKDGWKNPRSWMRSTVQKECYLYFVCAVSLEAVSPPIKLKVAKDWVSKVAPVLTAGLYLLQVSMKAAVNSNLHLDGAASGLLQVSLTQINEMLHEVAALLDEEPSSRGLLDRLIEQQLSDGDVKELCGDGYELMIDKASEQNGWRSQMEPVWVPPNPKVFWVAKEMACNPKYGFELIGRAPTEGVQSVEGSNLDEDGDNSSVGEPGNEILCSSVAEATSIPNCTKNDFLLGRGAAIMNHEGNLRMRRLLSNRVREYREPNGGKIDVLRLAIAEWRSPYGGRFLKRNVPSGSWQEIDERDAEKTVQKMMLQVIKAQRNAA